jgi:hypothetical protein
MAKGSTHQSSGIVKMLYVGTSGTGKTGSLASLIEEGYEIRALDMDNGLDYLVNHIKRNCPERIDQLDYITIRDKMKADKRLGAKPAGNSRAYVEAVEYMNEWDDGSIPAEWGENTIFVLDSLTLFGRAALRWAEGLNPTAKDRRQWYAQAQKSLLDVLDMLTSSEFKCNVIVISHIDMVEHEDGSIKGYASSVGAKLGPKIPSVFNTMIMATSKKRGREMKREILTIPAEGVDLKNSSAGGLPQSLPLETGMATIFKTLKGQNPPSQGD